MTEAPQSAAPQLDRTTAIVRSDPTCRPTPFTEHRGDVMYKPTPRSSTLTRVSRSIEALARALFARSDRNARKCGWDVTVTGRWGTSRVYHDPRYDRLATCTACAGHGCSRCAGTGRVTRRPGPHLAGPAQRPVRDGRRYRDLPTESSPDRIEPTWLEPRRTPTDQTTPGGGDRWGGVVRDRAAWDREVRLGWDPPVRNARGRTGAGEGRPAPDHLARCGWRQGRPHNRNSDAGGIGWDRGRR